MEVFRISVEKYASSLTASGCANRWNKPKQFVVYTAAARSLATLEMVVHRSAIQPTINYKVMIIDLPDDAIFYQQVEIKELPKDWRTMSAYPTLQKVGASWYDKKESLILSVPSVVIPQEYNYIINTTHLNFSKAKLISVEDYFWDRRLL